MKTNKKQTTQTTELTKGGMGTASLVLGITGLFLFPMICSPLAIIFGSIGISREEKYSKAGLTLGIIGVVGMILLTVLIWSFLMTLMMI